MFIHHAESPETGNYYRFKALASRVWTQGNGFDEGQSASFRVIGSKKLSQADQRRALMASIAGSDCHHAYDCCGCPRTHAAIRIVKRGIFAVQTRTSYNY